MSDATASSIDGTDPAFSRSAGGVPMGWGKCTERLSADVPDALYEAVTRDRLRLDMGEAEYVRYALMRAAMGPSEAKRLHLRRLDELFGSGPESGAQKP